MPRRPGDACQRQNRSLRAMQPSPYAVHKPSISLAIADPNARAPIVPPRSAVREAGSDSTVSTVEVGRHKDIETLGVAHEMGSGSIDQQVVQSDFRKVLRDGANGLQEQSIRHVEAVGLVDGRDLAASLHRELERAACDALAAVAREHLPAAFHDSAREGSKPTPASRRAWPTGSERVRWLVSRILRWHSPSATRCSRSSQTRWA
jgi:hypothetical protein